MWLWRICVWGHDSSTVQLLHVCLGVFSFGYWGCLQSIGITLQWTWHASLLCAAKDPYGFAWGATWIKQHVAWILFNRGCAWACKSLGWSFTTLLKQMRLRSTPSVFNSVFGAGVQCVHAVSFTCGFDWDYACWQDEDFVGRTDQIARASGTHALSCALRCTQKMLGEYQKQLMKLNDWDHLSTKLDGSWRSGCGASWAYAGKKESKRTYPCCFQHIEQNELEFIASKNSWPFEGPGMSYINEWSRWLEHSTELSWWIPVCTKSTWRYKGKNNFEQHGIVEGRSKAKTTRLLGTTHKMMTAAGSNSETVSRTRCCLSECGCCHHCIASTHGMIVKRDLISSSVSTKHTWICHYTHMVVVGKCGKYLKILENLNVELLNCWYFHVGTSFCVSQVDL